MHSWLCRSLFISHLSYALPAVLVAGATMTSLPSPAAAADTIEYQVCVRVPNRKDAGTDDPGFYITLAGLKKTSVPIKLDNPGVNDLNQGKVSCFRFLNEDIGHINRIYLNMTQNDDICVDAVDVSRSYQGQPRGQTSQFRKDVCLGNDAPSPDIWLASNNPISAPTVGKARGRWVVGCSGGQNCETQLKQSLQLGTVTEDSWSQEVQESVAVSIESGVEFGAGSFSSTFDMSTTTTRGSAGSIARSSSQSVEESCKQSNDFTKYDVAVVYQWQVEVPVGNTRVTVKTCQLACQSSRGAPPQHRPLHPVSLESCTQPKATAAPAPASVQPQAAAPAQGDEAAQLAAMMGVTRGDLERFVAELRADGYGDDAVELIVGNEIAIYNNQPSLSEAEVDARLVAMGYEIVDAAAPSEGAAPTYLGCFTDAPTRDLNGHNEVGPAMTGAVCAGICGQRGFQFAGTQYTNQCFCGNSYGQYGSTNPCNTPCAGNPNETCGGAYANSVYQVK